MFRKKSPKFVIRVHDTGEVIFDFGKLQSISIENMKSVVFGDLFVYFLNNTTSRTLTFEDLKNQTCAVYGNGILLNKCDIPTRIMWDMKMECYVTFYGFLPYRDKNTSNVYTRLVDYWKKRLQNIFTHR